MLSKYKYILSALLFFLVIVGTHFVSQKNIVPEVSQVSAVSSNISNCEISEIKEENEKFTIRVYFPNTNYEVLNTAINDKINVYVNDFKKEIEKLNLNENSKYKLEINFSSYEYENYLSYVFSVFTDFGEAHPNEVLSCISYDVKSNQLVDITSLTLKNENLLNLLSEYCYNELKENSKIKENNSYDFLIEGTKSVKHNFENFAFTKEGLKIFFNPYTVAPYYLGKFEVVVPYDILKK